MKHLIKFTAAVLLAGSLGWYLLIHQPDALQLQALPATLLATILIARLAAYLMLVCSTWWITRQLAPGLGIVEYFNVSANGVALSMVGLPGSTYAVKTLYLKDRHQLRHQDFLAISLVVGLLALTAAGVVASGALLLLHLGGEPVPALLRIAVGILLIGPLLAALSIDRLLPLVPSGRLASMKDTYRALLRDPLRLGGALLAQLGRAACSLVGFGLLFQAVSGAPLLVGGVVDALSTLLRLVYLLPGNIGIYEWSVGALAGWLGTTTGAGVVAAALYRLAGMVAVISASLILRTVLTLAARRTR